MKLMDPERHKYYTGVDNALILSNIEKAGKERRPNMKDHKKAINPWSK